MDELAALVVLSSKPYLGAAKAKRLIERFGSAVEVVKAPLSLLKDVLNEKTLNHWNESDKSLENMELAYRHQVRIIPFTSPVYPKALLELSDHPIVLYMKGELKNIDRHSIAIVGTRQASAEGLRAAEKIAGELANKGFTIVSGLARGIDTAAHKGALAQGRTIAIIGSGLAYIYPQENGYLADLIAEKGAVLSEFPMAAPPEKRNFPRRNRLVSGMTLGILLIEAPIQSGAMITMEKAWSQNKRLFALTSRADSENFRGNQALIASGRARCVENGKDVTEELAKLHLEQNGVLQLPLQMAYNRMGI